MKNPVYVFANCFWWILPVGPIYIVYKIASWWFL